MTTVPVEQPPRVRLIFGALLLVLLLASLDQTIVILTTMAVVGDIIPPRERGRYQGMFGAVLRRRDRDRAPAWRVLRGQPLVALDFLRQPAGVRAGRDASPPALWSLARLGEGGSPTSREGLDELRALGLADGDGLTPSGRSAAERLATAREARWSEVLGEWSPEAHPEGRELVERVRASFAAEPPSRG